jgi:hypothetical protein
MIGIKNIPARLVTVLLMSLLLLQVVVPAVWAQEPDEIDKELLAPFYAPDSLCILTPSGSASSGIFVIGDSLTVGMRDAGGLEEKLKSVGWTVHGIEATEGDTVQDAIPKLQANINKIKASGTVVIALGTNPEALFANRQKEMMDWIRQPEVAPAARVYWMNVYTKTRDPSSTNATITANAPTLGYQVMDWQGEALANPNAYPFVADGIHHTGPGYSAKAAYLARQVGAPSAGTTAPTGGTPTLVGRDNAEKIWNFLLSQGLTPQQAAGLMGNIQQESNFNPAADQGGPNGPASDGGDGYGLVQWDKGRRTALFAAAAAANVNAADLAFQLQYMVNESKGRDVRRSSHPVITQPTDAPNEWEGLKRMTTVEHATYYWEWNFERPGKPHTENRIKAANDVFARFSGSAPATSTTATGALCSSVSPGSQGIANADGYSWPMEPQSKSQKYVSIPCNRSSCHHDGTPAFDLYYGGTNTTAGKKVYAITDGVVERIRSQANCRSIQLRSAKDGYWYWYGHLSNVNVAPQQNVKAGEQVAQVAFWSPSEDCGGSSGRDHLHIDRGCVEGGVKKPGGSKTCRDPGMVPLINAIWEALPS